MNSTINKDYRPKNYQELLKKYREVSPKILQPEVRSSSGRRILTSGLTTYSGTWSDIEKSHLLKRCLFGVRRADLKALDGLSLDESVNLLLTQRSDIQPPVNDYDEVEQAQDPDVPFGETWIYAPYGNDWEGPRTVSLKGWVIRQMVNQPTSLEEKMILFWHNLLPVQTWGVFYGKLSYQYFMMLRKNVFGNFKTMIRDLTLDSAMLIFLNGTYNNKEAPDENYGRELQELFCIGKGPGSHFTEEDVQSAARVLTGWVIDWENWDKEGEVKSLFYAPYHETSDKQFSSFYGNKVIKGREGSDGAQELDELLDMIFDTDESALYICRRLYRFFVYNDIDEQTEANVIAPLAQVFRDSGFEIKPVLQKLFMSEHFFDKANRGAMIKSPAEYTIGLWRTLEMHPVDDSDLTASFLKNRGFLWNMANIGMEIGDPPSVSGWPAYYQEPSFDKYWITTDTIANRAISSDSLVYWGFWLSDDMQFSADLIAFLQQLDQPEDINVMLREVSLLFHGIELSDDALAGLKNILLSGQQNDGYWTSAWLQLMSEPDNEEYRQVVENRLKPTFQFLLQMGEAQLM